eukprot:GHVU01122028.1.p4 GENE.GHVU01122028.1~~GHVU01122028.1.p4  ORF type:complete len:104 (+),score=15.84 GHVU01122028.1:230-541(+)
MFVFYDNSETAASSTRLLPRGLPSSFPPFLVSSHPFLLAFPPTLPSFIHPFAPPFMPIGPSCQADDGPRQAAPVTAAAATEAEQAAQTAAQTDGSLLWCRVAK